VLRPHTCVRSPMIRVYMDTCCFNRPFDDQSQLRVRLESEATLLVLESVTRGKWALIGSDALDAEIAAIRDPNRRRQVMNLTRSATEHVSIDADRIRRQQLLESMGFGRYDSVHIACAEAAAADVLLTTDDALIRRARRLQHHLAVRVANPVSWLEEIE
jgi:predicted nucleic acid-binding protein